MLQFWRIAGLFFFLWVAQAVHGNLNVDVKSSSALLINAHNGKVLFAKNASEKMSPASCTKIAFALYAIRFHKDQFDKVITCSFNALKAMPESQKGKNNFADVPSYVLETDASHMGLKLGEEMTFYELLEATMVISADDASNVIAEVMGKGSIEKCVEEVNHFVRSLGCKNTHFTNPHGLYHPDHLSTAEDLALLCQEAMKEPILRDMAKKAYFQRPATSMQASVPLKPTNRLLVKTSPHYYPHAIGIKTGYHRRAGCCLTTQAEKDDRSLIAVILQAKSSAERFQDAKALFEAAFQETKVKRTFFSAGPQTFSMPIPSGDQPLSTYSDEPLSLEYYPSEEPAIRCQLAWNKISLPLIKGTAVGELMLIADNKLAQKIQLYAANDVKVTFRHQVKQQRIFLFLGIVGCPLLLILFFLKRGLLKRS